MSMNINAGENVKRRDMYMVDPTKVHMNAALRGRSYPPTEHDIIQRAISMAVDGQQQPVTARRNPADNTLSLVSGFTRTAAARLLREGFTYEGVDYKREDFMLKILIVDVNDKQAFRNNIVENAQRNETSPIDDADNQHILRDRDGMSDTEIARLYGYKSSVKVGRLRKLLALPEAARLLVHAGKMGVQAAIDLLALPDDETRMKAIEAATNESGNVNGADIVQQVREHHFADAGPLQLEAAAEVTEADLDSLPVEEASESGKGKGSSGGAKPVSLKEQRAFFAEIQEDEYCPELRAIGKVLAAWVNGKKPNKYLLNQLVKFGGLETWKAPKVEEEVAEAA